MGLIYMYTSPSGGRYIGQTIFSVETRWRQHVNSSKLINSAEFNTLLSRALRKYGEYNFKIEILEDNILQQELDNREIYWIDYYKTYFLDKQHGYNLTRGGQGTRKYNSIEFLKYWEQGLTLDEICKITKAAKDTISRHLKECNISSKEIHQRSRDEIARKQIKCDLNQLLLLWNQGLLIKDIGKQLNYYNETFLSKILIKYLNISQQEIINRGNYSAAKKQSQPITQYDINGNIIQQWPSANEIQRQLGYDASTICKVCNGKFRSAYGYIWRKSQDSFDPIELQIRDKQSSQNRKNAPAKIPVICQETQEIFPSVRFLANKLQINYKTLSAKFLKNDTVCYNDYHYTKQLTNCEN